MPGEVTQALRGTYSFPADEDLIARIRFFVQNDFLRPLQPKVEAMTLAALRATYEYDRRPDRATPRYRRSANSPVRMDDPLFRISTDCLQGPDPSPRLDGSPGREPRFHGYAG